MIKEVFLEVTASADLLERAGHGTTAAQDLFMNYIVDVVLEIVREGAVKETVGRMFRVNIVVCTGNDTLRKADWTEAIRRLRQVSSIHANVFSSPNSDRLIETCLIAIDNPHYRPPIPGYTIEGPNAELLPVSAKIDISQLK